MTKPIRLTAFLGHETTLRSWDVSGILDRELTLYNWLQERDVRINLISYGGPQELQYAKRMPGIKILCNRFGLPPALYRNRIHQLHGIQLLQSQVARCHATTGLISALRAHWAWQTPFIARFSFNWSESVRIKQPQNTLLAKRVDELERRALARADQIIAATEEIAEAMIKKDPGAAAKLTVIPNFVNERQFRPIASEKKYDLVFVGRVNEQKNLAALLEAVERLGLTIAMIGGVSTHVQENLDDQHYLRQLTDRFGNLNGRIHWLGRIGNDELPSYINQARAFILCSHIEGHPRAIVEAMACGMPIIASNVHGIGSMIAHERTGFLCETDADSIASAIEFVLAKPRLMEQMGAKARQYALARYAMDQVVQREYELINEVASRKRIPSAPRRLAQYLMRRNPRW